MRDLSGRLQIALGGFAGGIADHAGGTTGQRDGMVALVLKAAEREERDEVADMERVGGRIKAAIECDRAGSEARGEHREVGAVGEEATPAEFVKNGHAMGGRLGGRETGGQAGAQPCFNNFCSAGFVSPRSLAALVASPAAD